MTIAVGDTSVQLQVIRDYLNQGRRINGTVYIDQAGAKQFLQNLVTHMDFRQRQTIVDAFTDLDPAVYFDVVNEVLTIITEYSGDYTGLALTEQEKQGLVNVIENRVVTYFGADIT